MQELSAATADRKRAPFHPDRFAPLVGSVFTVEVPGGGEIEMTLVEMTEPRRYTLPIPNSPGFIGFGLSFRGPAAPVLPQRIYRMRNALAGEMEFLFLPEKRGADGAVWYYAGFNVRDPEHPGPQSKEQPDAR